MLGAGSITSEAQQALLKLFEEPQEGVVFVLLVPHGALLATLKSRMLAYPHTLAPTEDNPLRGEARKFLKMSGKERSDFLAKVLKDDEEGLKERVRDFVNALEAELAPQVTKAPVRQGLEDLTVVRGYLGDRSASLKMLLEHLALALPTL